MVDRTEKNLVAGPERQSVGQNVEAFRRVVRDREVVRVAVQECGRLTAHTFCDLAPNRAPYIERRMGLTQSQVTGVRVDNRLGRCPDGCMVQVDEVSREEVFVPEAADSCRVVSLESQSVDGVVKRRAQLRSPAQDGTAHGSST